METTSPVVEIIIKPELMESENAEENEQNGYNQQTEEVKEEELWIKTEPLEEESQDFIIKEEGQGTLSENDARLDEEDLNDECNRNRQSNAPSRKQILVFLDFLNEHRELANCMLRGPTGRAKAQQLWEGIAERLNTISGCIKTTQQWQRVWSDKKYLTRKAAATRYASLSAGGLLAPELTLQDEKILAIIGEPIPPRRISQKPETPEVWSDKKYLTRKAAATRYASLSAGGLLAPELTLQDEKILAIIGEPIPPRRVSQKPETPEPKPQTSKQPQEVLVVSVPSKPGPVTIELEPQPVIPQPELPRQPNIPPRKPYTPRKTESLPKEASRKSDILQSEVPATPVIPPDVSKPPDDSSNPVIQKQDDSPPSPSVSDPSSPSPTQLDLNRQGRVRPRACLDPYTKKFIHLEEERLKNDARRNTELSEIRLSLQQGTAELAGIRKTMQEMLGLMKQITEREEKK